MYWNSSGVWTCVLYSNCSNENLALCASHTTATSPKLCGPGIQCPQSSGMGNNCGGCLSNGACFYNGNGCNASSACTEIQSIITLPVELIDFNGSMSDIGNELFWSTASEWNSSHFNIEHSLDGILFTNLYSIEAAGNSHEIQRYSLTHVGYDKSQINYYRLIQVDKDGKSRVYAPISIDNREIKFNSIFSDFYPNPSDEYLYFQYGGKNFDTEITISILNTMGELVFSQKVTNFNKYQGIQLSISALRSGIYQVLISQADNFEIKKITIVH